MRRSYHRVPWPPDPETPTETTEAASLEAAGDKLVGEEVLASVTYPPLPHWDQAGSPATELVFDADGQALVLLEAEEDPAASPPACDLLDRTPGHRLRAYREGFWHLAGTRTELADQRRQGPYRGPTTRMDPYTLPENGWERVSSLVPAEGEDPDDPQRLRSEETGQIWHVVPEGVSRIRIDPAFAFHLYLDGSLQHVGQEVRSGDRYCVVRRRDKPRGNETLYRVAPLFTEGEELPVSYKTAAADVPEVQA